MRILYVVCSFYVTSQKGDGGIREHNASGIFSADTVYIP